MSRPGPQTAAERQGISVGADAAWRPDRYADRRPRLIARTAILRAIRSYFEGEGFIEVETPILQRSPGLEPHLQAFRTTLVAPEGGSDPLFLHTSPEFAMKKLLAAGEPRIFQFARVMRNGERAAAHHPEFTMLEWYRAGGTVDDIAGDLRAILLLAAAAASSTGIGDGLLRWQGQYCDPFQPMRITPLLQAVRGHTGVDLRASLADPAAPDPQLLARDLDRLKIRRAPDDDWDALFFKLFLDRVEPRLGHPAACLVTDYPIHLAALARAKTDAPQLAERFELYVCGLELANGFGELTDAAEQLRRFEADMDLKQRLYGERYPIDSDFLAALAHGLPETTGIALGFDRLVMLATAAARIEDVLWLPVARPGEGVMPAAGSGE